MNPGYHAAHLSEAVVRAAGHHDALHVHDGDKGPKATPREFSIAISRAAGTRSSAVARAVSELLGWQVYDQELLELVARDLNVRVKRLEDVDERHVTWLQECVEALAAVPAVTESRFVHHLVEVLMSLATGGRSVIVGRGGAFVLPASTTLRVRLVAPLEDRIGVLCHEQQLTRSAAARLVAKTDSARAEFVKLHFQCDPADPQYYDLVLNMASFPIDQCAHLIVDALRMKSAEPNRSPVAHEDRQHAVVDAAMVSIAGRTR